MGCASSRPEPSQAQVQTTRKSDLTVENVKRCSLDTGSKSPFAAAARTPIALTDTSDLASHSTGDGLSHGRWPFGVQNTTPAAASTSRSIPLFGNANRKSMDYRMYGAAMERARLQAIIANESLGEPVMDDSDLSTGELDSPVWVDRPWEDEAIWMSSPVRDHFLFADLDHDAMRLLAYRSDTVTYARDHFIVRQGDKATRNDVLFILKQGDVRIQIESTGPETREVIRSAPFVFGEVSLLFDTKRSASVMAITDVVLLTLTRSLVRRLHPARTMRFLRMVPVLQGLSDNAILSLSDRFTEGRYTDGSSIIKAGQPGHTIYLLRHGWVQVRSPRGQELATLQRGQIFGHRTLVTKQLRSADCIAHGEVAVLIFDYSEFPRLDNPALRGLMDFDAVMAVLKVLGVVEHDVASTDAVYDDVDRVQTTAGDVIVREGQTLRNIFIVRDGRVDGAAVREANGYRYFGSLDASVCTSDIIACENTMLLVHPSIAPQSQHSTEMPRRAPKLVFSDLEIIRVVGVGNSGRVFAVTHRPTGLQYALKAMDKSKIRYKKQSQHVHNELHILSSVEHPFCTAFVQAYQDKSTLYILQEWMPGGELFHHMQRQDVFSEETAKFYTACVVVALEYLHGMNILYRDLKPENLLMDRTGYIKLADFGFSKVMRPGERTFTICGTPSYQAPEIITRVGTTAAADFWSLGVLIHEMLVGATPFEEEQAPFGRVAGDRIALPKHLSDGAQNLIKRLLIRNPHERLGGVVGASAIINHAWFSGFDWTALRTRRMPAPIIPHLASNADTSYFEAFDGSAGRDATSGSVPDSFDTTWDDWDWVENTAAIKL